MGKIYINEETIEYEEVRSPRAKRLIITVRDGKVKVTMPPRATSKQVGLFVEAKKQWIYAHWKGQQAVRAAAEKRDFFRGVRCMYRGKPVAVKAGFAPGKARVELGREEIILSLPLNEMKPLSGTERQEEARKLLTGWYRSSAQRVFKGKLDYYARLMDVSYKDFRVKDQKTKWGSCSGAGNINLNWRLIMAPDDVLDYLIVHELAHLRHPNHSREFWSFVGSFKPDYPECRKWLKTMGKTLVL